MSAPDFFGLDTPRVWDTDSAFLHLKAIGNVQTKRTAERRLHQIGLLPVMLTPALLCDELGRSAIPSVLTHCIKQARKKRKLILLAQLNILATGIMCLHANDLRGSRYWLPLASANPSVAQVHSAIVQLQTHLGKQVTIIPHGDLVSYCRSLQQAAPEIIELLPLMSVLDLQAQIETSKTTSSMDSRKHLNQLEAESIHIIREAVAEAENPAMLYSIGKDSSVMLHLARKAFFPAPPPFPLVHVDTRWKFQEMYLFREYIAQSSGMELLVHINPEALAKDINPFEHGSALHTDITKTEGLKQALERYQFDVVFGGARRDEEKSRAKERIFSFRSQTHRWDPKNQRPELWNNYNLRKTQGESIRVFPLSNWTELDIWQYIYHEHIPVVPLYFAKERPVVVRDGMILMVDDSRMRLLPDEIIEKRSIRFRTLGCYPLSGAIESQASSIADIIVELLNARSSERQGRMIDTDAAGSMERKKQEGYF